MRPLVSSALQPTERWGVWSRLLPYPVSLMSLCAARRALPSRKHPSYLPWSTPYCSLVTQQAPFPPKFLFLKLFLVKPLLQAQ